MGRCLCAVLLILSVPTAVRGQAGLEIALKQGSVPEAQTKEQLQRLVKTYDVSRWIFTKSIVVDERAIPHSHPVLTLHARHLLDDDLLLSTLVHEQFHWFLVEKESETKEAIAELRPLFATVPVSQPEG